MITSRTNILYSVLLLFVSGCACNSWSLVTYQPDSNEAWLHICDSLMGADRSSGSKTILIAKDRINNFLKTNQKLKGYECSTSPESILDDARGPQSTIKIICKMPRRESKISGVIN